LIIDENLILLNPVVLHMRNFLQNFRENCISERVFILCERTGEETD